MKWLGRFSFLALIGILALNISTFFKNNAILVFSKREIDEARMDAEEDLNLDLRGTPTHECVCGSTVFNLPVVFDNYEIANYFLDMQCIKCGSIYTAPTPLDRENME